jgi:hypothetical protein
MALLLSNIRWLRLLSAALAVIGLSLVILMIVTAGYATALAFQARGAPNQIAINHFAAGMSPQAMPWLECVLTFVLSFGVFRRTKELRPIHGLLLGILAGLFAVVVMLCFRGHLGLRSFLIFVLMVALGWVGGLCAQKWPAKT